MKKFLLSFSLIFVFTSYVLYQKQGSFSNSVSLNTQNNLAPVSTPVSTSTPPVVQNVTPSNNPVSNFFNSFSENEGGGDDGRRVLPKKITTVTTTKPKVVSNPTPKPVPAPTPAPVPVVLGMYKDGTYSGSSEPSYSDYIQVDAIIRNGKLADVQFPSSGGGPRRSQQIYAYAMPQLRSEAISAQSANVDAVSGASYTSQAFQQSLATALSNAKN